MRKLLLGTTAVVGLALTGAAAQAQTAPTVRIGGFLNVMGNFISDSAEGASSSNAIVRPTGQRESVHNFDFRNETEIHVFVDGKAANGLTYGAVVEIQNDNSNYGGAGSTLDLDEAYIFMTSPTLGTVKMGEEDHAAYLIKVFTPTVRGLGPDGDYDDSSSTSASWASFTDGVDATKVIYLSPQFFGFDFGVSYAANTGEGERREQGFGRTSTALATTLQRGGQSITNDTTVGARYRGTFAGVGVAASAGARWAESPHTLVRKDLTNYDFGLNLSYLGFTLGGEYMFGNYDRYTNTPQPYGRDQSNQWSVGLTYTIGPVAVGGFYAQSHADNGTYTSAGVTRDFKDRQENIWGVGAAYTLAPGLEMYASYTELQNKASTATNSGATAIYSSPNLSSFLVGTRLAF